MELFLTYFFSAMCVGGALGVLFVNGYVNAAMSMLCSVLGLAGLAFSAQAYLLALLIVMVYAGAVMVLFVFTIMMMGSDKVQNSTNKDKFKISGLWILACVLLGYYAPKVIEFYSVANEAVLSSKFISAIMFTKYALHIQVIGILLLVAMIAVIAIAKDDRKPSQKIGRL